MAIRVMNGTSILTAAPTGLSIKRAGTTLTFSWKYPDNYDRDRLEVQVRKFGSSSYSNLYSSTDPATIAKKTSHTYSFYNWASFYPNKEKKSSSYSYSISFRVRIRWKAYSYTNSSYMFSQWKEVSYFFDTPPMPTVTNKLDNSFTTTFSWSAKNTDSGAKYFLRTQWQSVLIKDKNISKIGDIAKYFKSSTLGWQTNTGGDSGSKQIAESTTLSGWLTTSSYVRWFRIRTQGPAGDSSWVYSSHVYARPNAAMVYISSNRSKAVNNNANGIDITAWWWHNYSFHRPIDTFTVQYYIGVPVAGARPDDGVSWSNAPGGSAKPAQQENSHSFKVDNQLDDDQCLWIRVNTKHDNIEVQGSPALLMTGRLKNPSDLVADLSQQTYKMEVSAKNNSSVPDSFLAVRYHEKNSAYKDGIIVGIIPKDSTSISDVAIPHWGTTPYISVQASTGAYTYTTIANNVRKYTITGSNIRTSSVVYGDTGINPVPPNYVSASNYLDIPGTARVSWTWTWTEATTAEISWSDREDAWESTAGPSTHIVAKSGGGTGSFNIAGLTPGKRYYVRVRLGGEDGEYSAYTSMYGGSFVVSSKPYTPSLVLSDPLILTNGTITAAWGFYSDDGSYQRSAQIAIVSNGQYTTVAHATALHHMELDAKKIGWTEATDLKLAVLVSSSTGRISDWSEPVDLAVADPLTISIDSTSLVEKTETIEGSEETRTYLALTAMPMTVTATGAGENGTTIIDIERSKPYFVENPDESQYNGSEGESIASVVNEGEGTFTITNEDLYGMLNDTAEYRLIATAVDSLGQRASETIEFEVDWAHKSIAPEAEVVIDNDKGTATLTPDLVAGAPEGDVCDIYRLSLDMPDLVVSDAVFGQTYIDPYPTIGENGGYRFVYRTFNNDYITQDKTLGWADIEGGVSTLDHIIDFESDQVRIPYNVDLSSNWTKDFKETKYLGGSVQGDWNPAVSRTGTINAEVVIFNDQETIAAMRRLAVYAGVCRVRTRDGSNYAANVEVSESRGYEPSDLTAHFSLTIVRVDQESAAGYLLENEGEEVNGMG